MTDFFEHRRKGPVKGVVDTTGEVVEFVNPGDTGQFKCINRDMIVEEVEMTDEMRELFNVRA